MQSKGSAQYRRPQSPPSSPQRIPIAAQSEPTDAAEQKEEYLSPCGFSSGESQKHPAELKHLFEIPGLSNHICEFFQIVDQVELAIACNGTHAYNELQPPLTQKKELQEILVQIRDADLITPYEFEALNTEFGFLALDKGIITTLADIKKLPSIDHLCAITDDYYGVQILREKHITIDKILEFKFSSYLLETLLCHWGYIALKEKIITCKKVADILEKKPEDVQPRLVIDRLAEILTEYGVASLKGPEPIFTIDELLQLPYDESININNRLTSRCEIILTERCITAIKNGILSKDLALNMPLQKLIVYLDLKNLFNDE